MTVIYDFITMADTRRFNLSMSTQNIKENKLTIIIFIAAFITVGLYFASPVLMLSASTKLSEDINALPQQWNLSTNAHVRVSLHQLNYTTTL